MKILLLLPSKIKQIFFRKFFNNKKIIISKIIILNKKKNSKYKQLYIKSTYV